MIEQLTLPDPLLERAATDRLFFALMPDATAASRTSRLAHRLCRDLGLTGRPLAIGRFHVSLLHIGDYAGTPPDIVRKSRAAAEGVTLRPFTVSFDRAASFKGRPGHHPYVLLGGEGVARVSALRRTLCAAAMKVGLRRRTPSEIMPHMTLLYDAHYVEELAVEPVSWSVQEFVLIHSLLRRSKYELLGRWPLRASR